jgi:hypothetical protein
LTQSDNQVRAEIAAALGDFKGDEGASSTETKLLQSDTSYETPAARDSSLRLWLSECLLLARLLPPALQATGGGLPLDTDLGWPNLKQGLPGSANNRCRYP